MTGRQRQQVSLSLTAASVEEAVAAMRARRGQARQHGLILRAKDDGRLIAQVPGGFRSSSPCLKGRFERGDGGVVFDGVIFESRLNVDMPRGFIGGAVSLALVAILLAVVGRPSPGSYILGPTAVLFGLIGYGLGRSRRGDFQYSCEHLMRKLTPLLPGARPLGEGASGIGRHLP